MADLESIYHKISMTEVITVLCAMVTLIMQLLILMFIWCGALKKTVFKSDVTGKLKYFKNHKLYKRFPREDETSLCFKGDD